MTDLSPLTDNDTVTIPGCERSFQLLKLILDGLKAEPDIVPKLYPGVLNQQYRINKVVYRFSERRNGSDSGMYLFPSLGSEPPLFYLPDLHLWYGGIGAIFGLALLAALGIPAALQQEARNQIMHKECEVVFVHSNDEWRIDSLTLL